mgnify:FL=1
MLFSNKMSSPLDNWNPPKTGKPEYYDAVKYVYKYLDFHISEDDAYTILNAFIEKWDESAGQLIREEDLVAHVVERLQNSFEVVLPRHKIKRVVDLILGYLYETGHFYSQEVNK